MEKYGVQISPKKINEREKKASLEKKNDQSNVPKDPDLGTEPFEDTDEEESRR